MKVKHSKGSSDNSPRIAACGALTRINKKPELEFMIPTGAASFA